MTFQLISNLLEKSENRGVDASGFWGIDGTRIFYHKEPIKASQFVRTEAWQNLSKYQPHLLLTHARGASKGVGGPHLNWNNHPFVNDPKTIGLVHNGRIEDFEYQALKQQYEVRSACDSEILLRMFENFYDRLLGIQNIFSLIHCGHMAVAVGEKNSEGDSLFLFRNEHRPLWLVDLREYLGQVFFFSEPNIWKEATQTIKNIGYSARLIELPSYEIWAFTWNDQLFLKRFYVEQTEERMPWKIGTKNPIFLENPTCELVSRLNCYDEIDENNPQVFLRWYSSKELIGQEKLDIVSLKENKIVNSTEKHWLQKIVSHQINLNEYDYFLEREAL